MAETLMDLEENSKPILHRPRSLLELASLRMSLNIWLETFKDVDLTDSSDIHRNIRTLPLDPEILTHVPTRIRKMIEVWFHSIPFLLDEWIPNDYVSDRYLLQRDKYSRLNLMVFGGNGRVHFEHTVANFLADESLDVLTKFKMACLYCKEEKIDLLWPLVKDNSKIDDLQCFGDCMLEYWICRKKGELNKMSLEEFDCIERRMIGRCRRRCFYQAAEYFLTFFSLDNRLAEIDKIFGDRCESVRFVRYLLLILDASSQRYFLDKYGIDILLWFVKNNEPIDYVMQCWFYFRDTITAESYCEKCIVKILRHRNFNINDRNISWDKHVEITLEQIWLNTPYHLKKNTLDLHFETIFDEYADNANNRRYFRNFGRDISFLLAVLTDVDCNVRKKFWSEYWQKFIVGVHPGQLEELMSMCLPNIETIEDFKRTLPDTKIFRDYYDALVAAGFHSELDELLNTLYPNRDFVLNIKRNLLGNGERIAVKNSKYVEWDKYVIYIESVVPGNAQADFKDKLFSFNVLKSLRDLFDKNKFCELKRLVSVFVSPSRYASVKSSCLDLFRDRITDGRIHPYDESLWKEFVSWCVDNDGQRFDNFIKSFQIDVIFDAAFRVSRDSLNAYGVWDWHIFETMRCRIKHNESFLAMRDFFTWYFKSNAAYENFTRQKLSYYRELSDEDIERIFESSKFHFGLTLDAFVDIDESEWSRVGRKKK